MKGIISKYIDERGFGFIAVRGRERDVFFHINSMKDSTVEHVYEGTTVEFELKENTKGDEAVNVDLT